MRTLAIALSLCLLAAPAAAQQAARTGKLAVTITDPSGAVIPLATVTVTPQEGAVTSPLAPVTASMEGLAIVENLAPGRYSVAAEFSGFETVTLKDVRVRAGDNKQKISLPLKRVDEAVTVGRDKQTAALDPLGNSFSTVLTREQIAALPDDPDEMEAALKAMAPPGSTMRVDGFSGGKLPPKSQIRSIRLPRMDMMAAQNHGGLNGAMFIDIMTQPGLGSFRGSTDFTFRDDALNSRNPFTANKGDESLRQGGLSLSGPIKANHSSYSITFNGGADYTTSNLLAKTLDGTIAEPVRQPSNRASLNIRVDSSINKDHAIRFSYARNDSERRNLGVGSFTLPTAGFRQNSTDHTFRVSENGAVGKRFFSESRVQLRWSDMTSVSATEAPTIRVNDAFTSGGAQQAGGDHRFEFEAASDLDYVRGKHSMRTGVIIEGGRYRSDASSNYLGTYTFASLADYAAGKPTAYTRRIGDPNVSFTNVQAGVYVQDDWRVHKTTMLSLGLRYEGQTLVKDQNNFSPRATITWAPFKNGKTTFRGGIGYFSDWLGTSTYEQTLRVDGFRQREVNIRFPSYPDAGVNGGTTPPTNRYLLGDGLVLPASWNANAGVERQVSQFFRVNASYTYRRGSGLLRGRNLNAPVNGVRPDPSFANVVEVAGDAGSRAHSLNIGGNVLAINWHRTILFMNYTYTRAESNGGGAFSLPANGDDLSTEWGPTQPRHRLQGQINMEPVKDLSFSVNVRAQSGSPYNITTGRDDNGDGVFSDRPTGVARNSAWTPGQWDIGGRLNYAIGFGKRAQAGAGGPQGVMIMMGGGGGGGPMGGFGGGAADKRYQVNFYVAASNLTNHNNYVGFS
ncbi:MAG: hypothetical protein EPO35_05815, partial [Acidobacteria bacterium]